MSLTPSRLARPVVASSLLLVLSVLLAGCGRIEPPVNVLLVSVDTLRPDRLGCYGATRVETPAIDGLARAGVRFDQAFTPVPLTLPAHWTILTGVEPWHHGVVDNGMTLAAPPAATLAERFAGAGYETAAFVSAFVLHRTFGLDRGFARYDDGPAADAALDQLLHATGRADERVDRALAWLQRERTRPFFLWLHVFDPHAPYDPPEGFRARYAERPYDGEVAFVDTQVARLLSALDRSGAAARTLVVLLSDHGESLGEHGEQTHGIFLYDATLRVPLILRLPGRLAAGEVRREPVTLADVAPTVLALAGLSATPGIDGRDLFGADRSPRQLAAISESPHRRLGWASLTAIRDEGWKYIAAPRPELYALVDDPSERRDRIGAETGRAATLARAAQAVDAALRARLAAGGTADPRSEERARLAALGYVSGQRPAAGAAPDPKDVIGGVNELDDAYQLLAEGRFDEADARLRALVAPGQPASLPVLEALARLARMRGREAEAESLYLQVLERDPEAVAALAQLVVLARQRGDHHGAVERGRRLVALAPTDGGASRLLAEALFAAGKAPAAEAEWRRGLAAAPRAGWLRLSFARFLIATGRAAEGRRELDRITADEDQPADLVTAANASKRGTA